MSKAFTKESDNAGDERPAARPQLPPGVINRITPGGAERLNAELENLVAHPGSAGIVPASGPLESNSPAGCRRSQGGAGEGSRNDDTETRKRAARIKVLQEILRSVVVTPPPVSNRDRAGFGALVRVRHCSGEESTYQIVGVEETDVDRGRISWLSPLAKALLSRRAGETVRFRTPAGEDQLQILAVEYA